MTSKPETTIAHRYCAEVANELETRWSQLDRKSGRRGF